jgi:hypothetical protein
VICNADDRADLKDRPLLEMDLHQRRGMVIAGAIGSYQLHLYPREYRYVLGSWMRIAEHARGYLGRTSWVGIRF